MALTPNQEKLAVAAGHVKDTLVQARADIKVQRDYIASEGNTNTVADMDGAIAAIDALIVEFNTALGIFDDVKNVS